MTRGDHSGSLYLSLFSFCGIAIGILVVVLGGKFLVLLSDFVELFHVLKEVLASLQGDEKFGFLGVSSASLNSDGSCSNLLEYGIIVSKNSTMSDKIPRRLPTEQISGREKIT